VGAVFPIEASVVERPKDIVLERRSLLSSIVTGWRPSSCRAVARSGTFSENGLARLQGQGCRRPWLSPCREDLYEHVRRRGLEDGAVLCRGKPCRRENGSRDRTSVARRDRLHRQQGTANAALTVTRTGAARRPSTCGLRASGRLMAARGLEHSRAGRHDGPCRRRRSSRAVSNTEYGCAPTILRVTYTP
jgi:hypothetical protein